MDFYIDWPTTTVIIVVAAMISLAWQAVRLAIWSTRIILGLGHQIRPLQSGKNRGEPPARDGASV